MLPELIFNQKAVPQEDIDNLKAEILKAKPGEWIVNNGGGNRSSPYYFRETVDHVTIEVGFATLEELTTFIKGWTKDEQE